MRNANRIRLSKKENVFDYTNIFIMVIICFVTLYPIWYTVILSFNDGGDAMKGGIFWFPRIFTLDNYKAVFRNSGIITAYTVTVLRTFIGTITNVFFTAMVAYAFSKKHLYGSVVVNLFCNINGLLYIFF